MSPPKSVTFVMTNMGYGGAETQVAGLCRHMLSRGWTVSLVSLLEPEGLTDHLDAMGVTWTHLGATRGVYDPRLVPRLRAELSRLSPSIVHSHTLPANFVARLARPMVRVPVLITSAHNIWEGGWPHACCSTGSPTPSPTSPPTARWPRSQRYVRHQGGAGGPHSLHAQRHRHRALPPRSRSGGPFETGRARARRRLHLARGRPHDRAEGLAEPARRCELAALGTKTTGCSSWGDGRAHRAWCSQGIHDRELSATRSGCSARGPTFRI